MPANPDNFEERIAIATDAFAALIAADAYIAGLPVLTERKGDIANQIQNALNKLGICIVALPAAGGGLVRDGETLRMRVHMLAQITEKPLFNKTDKPANAVMVRTMKAVDRKSNGLDPADAKHLSGLNEFLLDEEQPFRLQEHPTDVVYHVNATTEIEL